MDGPQFPFGPRTLLGMTFRSGKRLDSEVKSDEQGVPRQPNRVHGLAYNLENEPRSFILHFWPTRTCTSSRMGQGRAPRIMRDD